MNGEWLLTNGLGGYAMGPLDGPPSRSYHGFLVAATRPPDARMLLVGPIETWLEVGGAATRLDALEVAPGRVEGEPPPSTSISPDVAHLVQTVEVRGVLLERRAWMVRDANATVLRWRRLDENTTQRVRLDLTPLIACRDHHGATDPRAVWPDVRVEPEPHPVVEAHWGVDRPTLRMTASGGDVRRTDRHQAVHYREAAARGTVADEILLAVATFSADLAPGGELTLVLGTETGSIARLPSPLDAGGGLRAVVDRAGELVRAARVRGTDETTARLVRAADHFLVRRRTSPDGDAAADQGRTIIAGYPWFGDWGRDTMIALPGLALATGRAGEAARILRTWAGLLRDGLLPNHFPEAGGEAAYHSVDAPLWFVHAIGEHERATGDPSLATELRPAVEAILGAYRDGTRFGIGMDPADGLVRAGEGDSQPTWMDAKVDGRPITPRHGKPVEIQALWVNALRRAERWASLSGADEVASGHQAAARLAGSSFLARFWRPELGWLADVVDGPGGDDLSLRPNQLLALSLPHPLVDEAVGRRVLDTVGRHLIVPGGVRSLAPFEPGYRPSYQGPPAARDGAYHQGTAWTWLLGPWVDALARFRGGDAAAAASATALEALDPAGSGAIPEIIEPEPPHEPRGCPWQAWGVAELLRVHVASRA